MLSPLFLIGLVIAVGALWLFRQTLHVKPWVEERPVEGLPTGSGSSFSASPAAVGLGVFLAVATSLFALSICAYFMRMMAGDWRTLVFPSVLWLNTCALILSDLATRSARTAVRRPDIGRVRVGLTAGAVLSVAFLVGQVWAWQQLNASGYFGGADSGGAVAADPANSFFYLFTGLHGVHLLGGLWVLGGTTARAWQPGIRAESVRRRVELCAVYWRYLLLVWLVLLALLVPAVAELCRGHLL